MKRLSIIFLIIILTSLTSLSIEYAPNDNIWVAYDVYNEPIEKIIEIKPDWVFRVLNIWGNTLDEATGYSDDAAKFVKTLSENGIRTTAMIGGISISSKDNGDFIQKAGARDPLGRITGVDRNVLHGCYNRSQWQDRLEKYFDLAVNAGISAIELDQPAQEHWRGECYCQICNFDFTDWLIENNEAKVSKDFDYVDFLRKNRLAHINEGDRELVSPYGKKYWKYQVEKDSRNIGKITERFKIKHKNKAFFGNSWGLAGEYVPSVHFYSNIDIAGDMRTPWIWEPADDRFGAPYNSWIPVVKLARAIDDSKRILSFLDTYPYERVLEKNHDKKDEILAQYASEVIAAGCEFVFPYSNRVAYRDISAFDHDSMKAFISFLKNNKAFFGKRRSQNDILLIVDQADVVLKRFYKQYWAISYYLLDSSLDYDVVFRKDLSSIKNISEYKRIIDCRNFSEDIFKYCYNKDEKYIKKIKEKIAGIKSPYDVKGDKYTRIIRTSNEKERIDYLVPAQIEEKSAFSIIDKSDDSIMDIITFPENTKIKRLKKDGNEVISFDKKPYMVIIKKHLKKSSI